MSSKPPSTDRKEKRENANPGGAKPGHEGHSRPLHESPDAFEDHAPIHCDHCGAKFAQVAPLELIGAYDEIEIPPIKPYSRLVSCADPRNAKPCRVACASKASTQWVFCASGVVRATMDGHRPDVWTADRYSAQAMANVGKLVCLISIARRVSLMKIAKIPRLSD